MIISLPRPVVDLVDLPFRLAVLIATCEEALTNKGIISNEA